MKITREQEVKYEKAGVRKEIAEKVRTRAIDGNGKVYQGEAGERLLAKQQAASNKRKSGSYSFGRWW